MSHYNVGPLTLGSEDTVAGVNTKVELGKKKVDNRLPQPQDTTLNMWHERY